ncbi:MAG: carboxypeptidase M32, partial [Myxococcota bacterium]
MSTDDLWTELVGELRAVTRLNEIRAVLTWDQQVTLPAGGHGARAEQLALLYALHHARFAAPRVGELLHTLSDRDDLDDAQRAGVRNMLRAWRREAAVPAELVERLGRLQGTGHEAWMAARAGNEFGLFAPVLGELIEVSRARAAAIDGSKPAYDVLVDEFEPGTSVATLVPLFARLRDGLVRLIDAIRGVAPMPTATGDYPPDAQLALMRTLAATVGYDLDAGRVDLATHPFTINLGPGDVRVTTRLDPRDLLMGIGGTMHEVGHAVYEQGLPSHLVGTGLEGPASMGLHESQSRFWENTIGRSLPFFRWLEGPLRERFGAGAPTADALFRSANRVVPGPNRVSADEVTYNLHVAVRFELERGLIGGTLAVRDLRDAWNEAYRRDLGVDPGDDLTGVLQDIHWSSGAFGYFPTYTLGNLYAASIGRTIERELPALWDQVGRGELAPILAWLRDRVHRHGHRWDAPELVRRVVGD